MARIIDIVRARRNAIESNTTEAERTGVLAVAALHAGIHTEAGTPTQEWRDYMEHFPGLDATQLSRLLATDGTLNDTNLARKRAYLVSNAVCGANSPNTGALADRVNTIDDRLPGVQCDAPVAAELAS
jgi:hypothetical protein